MKTLLLNLPHFSGRRYCREIMGGFGLEVGRSLLYPPLPLAYTAAIMEREGLPVDLLDAEALELPEEEILRRVRAGGFDLVGAISSLITLKNDLGFMDRMKAAVPGVRTFLTGPIIHLYKDYVFEHSACDFTINTLNDDKPLELVRALEAGTLPELKGVSWRDGDRAVHNPPEDELIDMDTLPVPARHLLPNDRYFIAGMKGPVTTVQTARGCPYRCDLCAYKHSQGHLYRTRSLDRVMEELEDVAFRHGIRNVVFRDITFTVNRKRVMELCDRMIEARLGLTWWCETTLNRVDEELLARMKAAGLDAVSLGVETGNAEQIEEHWKDKMLGLDAVKEIFDTCRRLDIKTRGYFVMGAPGETAAARRETIRWAKVLRPTTLQFMPYRELPGDPDTYGRVDPEILQPIKRAYLAYYLTPANLARQFLQPRLFLNRVRRFLGLWKE